MEVVKMGFTSKEMRQIAQRLFVASKSLKEAADMIDGGNEPEPTTQGEFPVIVQEKTNLDKVKEKIAEKGPLSRQELIRETGLKPGSISFSLHMGKKNKEIEQDAEGKWQLVKIHK
ncbi:MAG: hypothetical protein ACYC5N_08340 [Endomicrobiales bacterium]